MSNTLKNWIGKSIVVRFHDERAARIDGELKHVDEFGLLVKVGESQLYVPLGAIRSVELP